MILDLDLERSSFLRKAQCQLGVNDNLTTNLSDSRIDHTAFLDSVSSGYAATENFGNASDAMFIVSLWYHLGRYLCRLPFYVLEKQNKFLS